MVIWADSTPIEPQEPETSLESKLFSAQFVRWWAGLPDVALRDEVTGDFLIADEFPVAPLRLGFFEFRKQLSMPPSQDADASRNLISWAQFFNTGIAPDDAPDYIKNAASIVNLINTTPEEYAMITKQQEFLDDLESAYTQKGFALGQAEGEAKGRAEERRAMAITMLHQGLSPEMTARVTGLTPSEIASLPKWSAQVGYHNLAPRWHKPYDDFVSHFPKTTVSTRFAPVGHNSSTPELRPMKHASRWVDVA